MRQERYDRTVACIGDGQLIRMGIPYAQQLGLEVAVLGSKKESPASKRGARQIIGELSDPDAIHRLAAEGATLTCEIEHFNASALFEVEEGGHTVAPGAETFLWLPDKLLQHQRLEKAGIPVAKTFEFSVPSDAFDVTDYFNGNSFFLKTRRGGYDGRGSRFVEAPQDSIEAIKSFTQKGIPLEGLYAEEFIDFDKEIAVMVVKGKEGGREVYPTVETLQRDGICVEAVAPARISREAERKAYHTALQVAEQTSGWGPLAIEMYTVGDNVVVNELAPRPHNSYHLSIEYNRVNQFENHIRSVVGYPLGSTLPVEQAAAMVNVLSEVGDIGPMMGVKDALIFQDVAVHDYGKEARGDGVRKIGHVTAVGRTVEEALETAHNARSRIVFARK